LAIKNADYAVFWCEGIVPYHIPHWCNLSCAVFKGFSKLTDMAGNQLIIGKYFNLYQGKALIRLGMHLVTVPSSIEKLLQNKGMNVKTITPQLAADFIKEKNQCIKLY
jgi:hypothetical protein